jgi:osmotically-inducible protein OsmY
VHQSDGFVTVEGNVERLADKRRIELLIAGLQGVQRVDNHLLLIPSMQLDDPEIMHKVLDALIQDRAIDETTIEVAVQDGVVHLTGRVPGLASKRYAGVLAWWVPGVRDVVNLLELPTPEDDNDAEITEVIRAALDKDPLVDAVGISVRTENGVVSLRGAVYGEEEREAAEDDAWYVLGVRDVDNRIKVSPLDPPRTRPGILP